MAFSAKVLEEALTCVRADWERDLRLPLPQFVAYEDVRRGIDVLRH